MTRPVPLADESSAVRPTPAAKERLEPESSEEPAETTVAANAADAAADADAAAAADAAAEPEELDSEEIDLGELRPSRPMSEPPPRMESVPSDLTGDLPSAIARFGRFEIMGGLATGGMADILLARESTEGSSRHTVIKIIRGEHSENGDFAQMFLDEGRLAMRLSHPNICTVYECGHIDGRFFMAMEYVHGRTLRDVLVRAVKRSEPLPVPVLLRVFSWVAEALDFAHRARDAQGKPLEIVHRDVSPQNVMIRYDGVVKLLDFGVAKAQTQMHESESGALKGKFAYMSPEQAESSKIDARSDIFSLGVMLFEAVTGRRLFHRKNQYSTLKALLESTPPPLSQYRPGLPEDLQTIVNRALARDPDDRYSRASDMQHDLERLITKSGKVVTTAHVAQLMEELFGDSAHQPLELDTSPDITDRFAAVVAVSEPPELEVVQPPRRRSTMLWMALGAVALTAVGIGLGVALAPGTEAAPPAAAQPLADRSSTVVPTPLPSAPPEVVESPPDPPDPEATATEATDPTEPTEATEPDPSTTETTPPPTSRRGRRRRGGRGASGGGGTVIVTDPGF
ncbi:MAG: serine/threonine protein kinase [Myxococcales bacterium]|nr:serine/threonine protein kinase [Myxococcales bacterium]